MKTVSIFLSYQKLPFDTLFVTNGCRLIYSFFTNFYHSFYSVITDGCCLVNSFITKCYSFDLINYYHLLVFGLHLTYKLLPFSPFVTDQICLEI